MANEPRDSKKQRPRSPLGLGTPKRGRPMKQLAFWVVLFLVLLLSFQHYYYGKPRQEEITFSQFKEQVYAGNIKKLTFSELIVRGEFLEEQNLAIGLASKQVLHFRTSFVFEDNDLLKDIEANNPDVILDAKPSETNWLGLLASGLPFLLLIVFWLFLMRQMQGGGNRAFSFGKSKAKLLDADRPKVTFKDVAGCDEAKAELQEIVEFLRDPKKFQRLGGRIPKGALLLGQPGTGKTLLARAVAGEASVNFYTMSGSDFVEMFVGVGASRVRDLFEQGKKNAPCIIFIDEIDAVGRHRGAGLGGGHDEREQTLNQLLVEMDGFESNDGVILIAATNRPDVLDPALLRPGRFDRQIVVDMPDVRGREGILKVHSRKIPMTADVDLMRIAKGTPGFSGADLANLVNEAALLAARLGHDKVNVFDMEAAKDKVLMGPERKSRVVSDETRRMVAYHEAGHALVAYYLPDCDPVHKVTIIPRGRAGGATFTLPEDDRDEVAMAWALDSIAMAMGGRAAETLILNRIGSGASSDIVQATKMARRMVTKWGMSEALGPVAYGESEEQVFLGKDFGHQRNYSESTAQLIDDEVKRLVKESYKRAENVLKEHADGLHKLAKALLERETMTGEELHLLLTGQELPPIPVDEVVKKTPEPTNVEDGPSTKEESAGGDATETSEATGEQSSIASDVPPAAAKNSDPEPPVKPSKADPEDFFGTQH